MWNSTKSLQLSSICTKLLIAAVFVFAAFLPKMLNAYIAVSPAYSQLAQITPLMVVLYLCCLPALAALFSLDRLLVNIKREEVFVERNVRHLRIISWCCFAVAAFLACAVYYYLIFLAVAIVAAFFGLILRVVKNVIEEAVIIKTENDFTI